MFRGLSDDPNFEDYAEDMVRESRTLKRLAELAAVVGRTSYPGFPLHTPQLLKKRLIKASLLAATTLLFGLAFWFPLRTQVRTHLQHITALSAQSVRTDVADEIRAQMLAQLRLAQLWTYRTKMSKEDWDVQARLFATHHPGYLALQILDSNGRFAWGYNQVQNVPDQDLRNGLTDQLRAVLQDFSRGADHDVLLVPIHLRCPESAHAAVVPIRADSGIAGFLIAVVDDKVNLETILNDHANLGYGIVIREGTTEIYGMPGVSRENEKSWGEEAELALAGSIWQVRVWPQTDLLKEARSKLPLVGFLTGSLIGFLLFSAIDFGRTSHRSSKAFQESQERLQAIISSAMDAIITVDEDQKIVVFNSAAEKIFACPSSQATGRSLDEFIPVRFRDTHRHHVRNFGLTGISSRSMDSSASLWALRSNGQEFPIEASISQIQTGAGRLYTVIVRDITIRRQAEEALRVAHTQLEDRVKERTAELHATNLKLESEIVERQHAEQSLQELSGHLMQLRDEEQRRIARELHDSTVQILGAASIELEKVQKLLPIAEQNAPKIDALLANVSRLVEQATGELRTMSYLLHPPILDDLGLADVLPWYAAGFTSRSGIPVEVEVPNELGRLPYETELTIFRIVQECLANIHRHSGSATANIRVTKYDTSLCMEVRDYGTGISPRGVKAARYATALTGVGIAGMRERVRQLGGIFEIESDPHGTLVRATLPVNTENLQKQPKLEPKDSLNRSRM